MDVDAYRQHHTITIIKYPLNKTCHKIRNKIHSNVPKNWRIVPYGISSMYCLISRHKNHSKSTRNGTRNNTSVSVVSAITPGNPMAIVQMPMVRKLWLVQIPLSQWIAVLYESAKFGISSILRSLWLVWNWPMVISGRNKLVNKCSQNAPV